MEPESRPRREAALGRQRATSVSVSTGRPGAQWAALESSPARGRLSPFLRMEVRQVACFPSVWTFEAGPRRVIQARAYTGLVSVSVSLSLPPSVCVSLSPSVSVALSLSLSLSLGRSAGGFRGTVLLGRGKDVAVFLVLEKLRISRRSAH